jgi:dTDP-4-dehydrorhamnose 3,5-epimerase
MIVSATRLADARLIDIEPQQDERGFFARIWCARELKAHGIDVDLAQENLSLNRRAGTLRGLHYQKPPHAEAKIVRCVRGAIFDVIVDIRPGSPTYGSWEGFRLDADNRRALYVPKGFAHGFQSLVDDTEVLYQMTAFHTPDSAAGFRGDDPVLAITWPLPVSAISARDRAWPDFPGDSATP